MTALFKLTLFLINLVMASIGGTKQLHNRNEDNRNSKKKATVNLADEIPIILTETYQRLDTYSKGVKNLFTAVRNFLCCYFVSSIM